MAAFNVWSYIDEHKAFQHAFRYNGEKTIKYVSFDYAIFDKFGDPISKNLQGVRLEGPFEPQKEYVVYDRHIGFIGNVLVDGWRERVRSIKLRRATVEYMDGTKKVYKAEDLECGKPESAPTSKKMAGIGCGTAVLGTFTVLIAVTLLLLL